MSGGLHRDSNRLPRGLRGRLHHWLFANGKDFLAELEEFAQLYWFLPVQLNTHLPDLRLLFRGGQTGQNRNLYVRQRRLLPDCL